MRFIGTSVRPLLPLLALAGFAFGTSSVVAPKQAAACSVDPLVGSVCTVGFSYCPEGYVEARGQMLAINDFQTLYALYGTTYGGDGRTIFGVPDFRARSPVGIGTSPYFRDPVQWGQIRGTDEVTITVDQLPAHSHTAAFTPTTGQAPVEIPGTSGNLSVTTTVSASDANAADATPSTTNNTLSKVTGPAARVYGPGGGTSVPLGNVTTTVTGSPAIPQQTTRVTTVIGGTVEIGKTGAGLPQPNIPPQAALMFCVATTGTWPSRP